MAKKEKITSLKNEELKTVFLDVRQFAEASGLPFSTVEGFINDGTLKAVIVGKRRLVSRAQLDNLPNILSGFTHVVNKTTKVRKAVASATN